jgi:hypothetical protein
LDVLAPLGCHYYYNEPAEQWEVALFASNTEVVGGKRDGSLKPSRFSVDLQRVIAEFDSVSALHWQTLSMGPADELGPHLSLEGTFESRSVWLRILAHAPARFESGRYFRLYEMRLEDIW